MKPLISIITPVYNSEAYLKDTLESILSQDFQNFELILLNDGSKDNSSKICTIYAQKDNRIKYIDKQNEGVATTRNKGLQLATGEYIMFVDSDDIIFPNSLKKIGDILANNQPDFLRYDFITIDKNGQNLYPNYLTRRRAKYANKVLSADSFMEHIMIDEYFLCMNVFKTSIINQYSICFKNGCTYNEDTLFILQFMQHSKTHLYTPTLLYGYRKYNGAVTARFTSKNYNDVLGVFNDLIQLSNISHPAIAKSMQLVIQNIGWHLYTEASKLNDIKVKREVKSNCIKNPVIIEWKLINCLGDKITRKIYPLITIYKKSYRKINHLI